MNLQLVLSFIQKTITFLSKHRPELKGGKYLLRIFLFFQGMKQKSIRLYCHCQPSKIYQFHIIKYSVRIQESCYNFFQAQKTDKDFYDGRKSHFRILNILIILLLFLPNTLYQGQSHRKGRELLIRGQYLLIEQQFQNF